MNRIRLLLPVLALATIATPLFAQKPAPGLVIKGGKVNIQDSPLPSGVYTSDAGIKLLVEDGAILELAGPSGTLTGSKVGETQTIKIGAVQDKQTTLQGIKTEAAGYKGGAPGDVLTVEVQSLAQLADGSVRLQAADGSAYLIPDGTYQGEGGLGIIVVNGIIGPNAVAPVDLKIAPVEEKIAPIRP